MQLVYKSESLSNTPFPIVRRVSLYLELISDEHGDRTSIIATVELSANHYSTRAEIFEGSYHTTQGHELYKMEVDTRHGIHITEKAGSYHIIKISILFFLRFWSRIKPSVVETEEMRPVDRQLERLCFLGSTEK